MKDEILKRELWDMTRNVTTALQAILGPVMEAHGLTAMQGRVLSAVKECDDVNVGTISKILDVCGSNASNMCKKLEKDGFIIRKRSKEDERVVELLLTEKGESVLGRINNELKERYGAVLKDMDDEKFDSIIKGITALNELLEDFEKSISNQE
ncbi:MarR family transcriptional regulator [Sedimentibacter hydroxybenzoicus DSM 7310]|uniref:HTH-type transcriptional regulator SarZ n=1 Tax=Sedimentibacter hydroxybenzoicus DSM 7310 TaxID=1123245 RepID=A0A974BLJ4_SEDHY|nr:MarR family transcriptional regulator [Sedimentibacter hydroxybenzoicus]NYB75312.1 MarR family transcriptional regulator [Sedimentibacter hydroxybenzoicus DSM 7310]